jgi:hypothetical protein
MKRLKGLVIFGCSFFIHSPAFGGIAYIPTVWNKPNIEVCWAAKSESSLTCETDDFQLVRDEREVLSDAFPTVQSRAVVETWINETFSVSAPTAPGLTCNCASVVLGA